ncbi:hypothetical protein BDW42DRAFT_27936 [Aspergillus taichungensis]|uniref:Uncharacterized protein n=1 Tax=Aspergillus taichungensis TaxID=482145 RepID=A0A2J5HGF2_9EURO|nr:hypothetical protein BDW42DRAFT_27936 [Aspergillus taichungensis]
MARWLVRMYITFEISALISPLAVAIVANPRPLDNTLHAQSSPWLPSAIRSSILFCKGIDSQ